MNRFSHLIPSLTPMASAVTGAGKGFTEYQTADGAVVRRDGARNWRNNNPGNLEYGDFAKRNGAIGTDGRFAVFPDYNSGRAAKESLLFDSPQYRNLTLGQAINRYAPPNENNTRAYTSTVADAIGVSHETLLGSLSKQQRSAMLDAMQKVEGFKPGREAVITAAGDSADPLSTRMTLPDQQQDYPDNAKIAVTDMMPAKQAAAPSNVAAKPRVNRFLHLIPRDTPKTPVAEPPPTGPQISNVAGKRDFGQTDFVNTYNPVTEGATFGASGEIVSGIAAPIVSGINALTGNGPTSISENFQQAMAQKARDKAAFDEAHHKLALGGELAGAIVAPMGPAAKFIGKGANILTKSLRSGAVGAGAGGTQGFFGTDGDVSERTTGGVIGAATGAVLGTLLPPVIATSRALLKGLIAPIRSLANKEGFAAGKVAEALQRDKMTPERVATRLAANSSLKGDLAVGDVAGNNTAALLRAAANVPSEARTGLIQQLEYRQGKQLQRLQEDIGGAFGDHAQFYKTIESIVNARKATAKPLFEKAFATPTPYTTDLEAVLKRPLTGQLVERARIAAANRGEKFKNIFIQEQPNGNVTARRVIDTEGLHRVKMTIDEMINGLEKGQPTGLDNVNMRDLAILKKDLVAAIENQPYKAALARYAGDSAVVNALDDGFDNGLKMDPELIRKTLSDLSPSEQKLWRLGFARSISDTLRDTGRTGTNRADILSAPKYIQRLEAAIPDKAARRDLFQAIKLEQRMYRTRTAVQGNSTTAKQLAEGQEAGVEAQDAKDMLNTLKQAGRGDFMGATISFLSRAKNTATGLRPEVADEIIKLITSKSPRAIRQAQTIINNQGRAEMFDGFRAIAAGISAGKLGEAVATQ
jgi:hypothetical protein